MATDLRLKEGLHEITEAIVATYTECNHINHLGHRPLPNRDAVIEILTDLVEILFPGFARRQNLHMGNVEYHVGDLIDGLHDKLTQQIARAMRHDCDPHSSPLSPVLRGEGLGVRGSESLAENGPSRAMPNPLTPGPSPPEYRGRGENAIDFEALAQQKTIELLTKLPDLRFMLEQDAESAFLGDPAAKSHHEIVFCYPGLEAITIYRIAHELLLLGVPLIPRMMTEFAHSKTGIDIHPGARIGPGFFIDHGTGVVIGETCDIGKNVKLYQGVTLGALSFPRDAAGNIIRGMKRHPTLEDDVVVYANATILGGDSVIGHHAVVGSSVWLTHGVEPYTVVTLEKPSLRIKSPDAKHTDAMFFEI